MLLILLRHGEPRDRAATDAERPLTARGVAQAAAAGRWLAGQGLVPARMLASPLVRARQTASHAARAWPQPPELEIVPWLAPESEPRRVCGEIGDFEEPVVMLVSHQPLVSALAGYLVEGEAGRGVPLGRGSLALFDVDALERGCASLRQLLHAPELMAAG